MVRALDDHVKPANNNNNNELNAVSSSNKDIGGVPSMQSMLFAEMKRNGICMEERSVHCKCVGRNPRDNVQAIDNYGGRDF